MAPGVTTKLFLAILLTNILTAVVVAAGVRYAFNAGFERYVAERETVRLGRLATVVGEAYVREGRSWDFLRGRSETWVVLNHSMRPEPQSIDVTPGPQPAGRVDRPPPGLVLDAQNRVVVGDADPAAALDRVAIDVDGQRVGWVAAPAHRVVFDVVDQRFRTELWDALLSVALLAIATAAIVAGTLSQGLLAPIKRLAGATRRMADGDYRVRVDAGTRDELGQLVEDFNRLGHALERQESVRRNFMADMSHELRTPISVLRAELEALEDGVRPVTQEAIDSLQVEVNRLRSLVDDVHDLSLADVGGLSYRFHAVDLTEIAVQALDGAQVRLEGRGMKSDVRAPAAPVMVRGDEKRLRQLVANLLENSLRYTHEGGRIRASVIPVNGRARLTWEDSPPGVPDAALSRLFERLYRVDGSRSREAGGSGLGLAICESIAAAHGGTIKARHSELGGLAVELELPREGVKKE